MAFFSLLSDVKAPSHAGLFCCKAIPALLTSTSFQARARHKIPLRPRAQGDSETLGADESNGAAPFCLYAFLKKTSQSPPFSAGGEEEDFSGCSLSSEGFLRPPLSPVAFATGEAMPV